jgi:uncharacterized protein (DUF58 family)
LTNVPLRRVRPPFWLGPRGIAAAIGFAVLAGVLARFMAWPVAASVSLLAFIVLAVIDGRASAASFGLRRVPPERYALAHADAFGYDLENRGSVALRCGIIEAPVAKLAIDAAGAAAFLPPRSRVHAQIAFVPRERGRTALGDSYAWYETAAGIVRHRVRLAGAEPIRVLPDLSALDAGDLVVRARAIDAGLRRLRRRGAGTEFESLRDYSAGDAFRDIDWKATARRGRVMVAQHEVERSQQVIVAIDCGRLMAARLGDRRKLDYAVGAALGIAGLARRAADRVGVHAFASTTLATVPPGSGAAQAAAIVEALADIEPQLDEPDYERAALTLRRSYRKRSLIVVFTDLFDPVASSSVLSALTLLTRQHLVLVALMNDAALQDALAIEPRDAASAYRAALATSLLGERARAVAALHAGGMLVVDVPARDLRLATLDAYLQIKTRGSL